MGSHWDKIRGMTMKRWARWVLPCAFLLSQGACGSGQPTPVVPGVPADPDSLATSAGPAAMPGAETLVLEEGKLYVALIWHQHQPFYFQDPQSGAYERPWVRVHAAKDYVDMAAILEQYPRIRATFNLTPSLIEQLDDIGAGTKDLYWLHSEIAAEDLNAAEKQFLLDRFFDINPRIIARFPRYVELSDMRTQDSLRSWGAQDFRDLQVLFNLAWTDPDWLAIEPLASLVAKGRGFAEADKAIVFGEHVRLVREVVPLHAELQRSGQIEVTMTPYAHPILPLLVNSDLARIALPDANLPTRFAFGQDAVAQVDLGVQTYIEHFGMAPRGMWPAEGAVADGIITMISNAGIRWMASDERVLASSLPDLEAFTRDRQDTVQQADDLYRPYAVQGARRGPVAILFRDHLLSDKVGFEYSGMAGEQAAADFVGRLEAIHSRLQEEGGEGPYLVTVLLDGENAWEYYPNDGKDFLHATYRLLSEADSLITVRPSDYLEAMAAAGATPRSLDSLWAGSWIDGTFSTWIGEEEENTAWEYLRRTREALQEASSSLAPAALQQALQAMYMAEGSDWFWWYGSDQNSGADDNFDRQFRRHLEQVYLAMGRKPPDFIDVPIIPQARQNPDQEPLDLIPVTADGIVGQGEWDDAGRYEFEQGEIRALYYGFSQEVLYLRVDTVGLTGEEVVGFYLSSPYGDAANAYSRLGPGETLIGFGAKALIELRLSAGGLQLVVFEPDGAGGWAIAGSEQDLVEGIGIGGNTIELAVPFARLFPEAGSGDRINLRVVLSRAGSDVGLWPTEGPALAAIPDLPVPNVFLEVDDPLSDDHGPGTYQYPRDVVFKPGVFDLAGLTVGYDEVEVIFRLQFRGPVINEWGSPNGLSVQTIDIYIDVDGPARGSRLLLPGRNAALAPEFAWDYAIWAEGWTPGIFAPGPSGPVQIDSGFSILTNPGQRRVTIRAPRSLIPGDPESWSLAVVILSQEGFPSAGVWRVRDVLPSAEQWRIGGGSGAPAGTRIMDFLWPAGNTPDQEAYLHNPAPPGVALENLGPDQYPQVPMIQP
jgi:alpha-amylase/alpha-mannosidase (GH57 family)